MTDPARRGSTPGRHRADATSRTRGARSRDDRRATTSTDSREDGATSREGRRAASRTIVMRRRRSTGITAGVAAVIITSAGTAAMAPQQSPDAAAADLVTSQTGQHVSEEHVEVASELVDEATAEVDRAAYLADSEHVDAATRTEITQAQAEVESLAAEVADATPVLAASAEGDHSAEPVTSATTTTMEPATTEAAASSATTSSATESSATDPTTDPTTEVAQEIADLTAGARTDEAPETGSTVVDSALADATDDSAPADEEVLTEVVETLPQADELAVATTELTAVLDQAEDASTPVVIAGPTPEEIAAQEAAEAKAAAEAEAARIADLSAQAAAYGNGEIPSNLLCDVSFDASVLLRCDAAAALEDLDAAYANQFGGHLAINSTYRSYAAQVSTKAAKGYLAATPGTSNHGDAVAVDLSIGGYGSAEYVWLLANAPAFGWDNPSWARAGGSKAEPWHWEFGTND